MTHRIFHALLSVLVFGTVAQAEPLRIGTETDYWPYIFHDDAGQRAGYDVDLMDLICQRGGFNCTWNEVSFDQIVSGVAEGQFDVSIGGIGATPQRDLIVDWTRPYRTMDTAKNHFAGLDENVDVTKVRIAVQADTIMEDVLHENGYDAVPYPSNSAAIDALLAGEVEAVFTSSSYLSRIDAAGSLLIDLGYLSYPDAGPQIAVPKSNPQLRRRLNRLIGALEDDGSLTVLNAMWFPRGDEIEL